MNFDLNDIYKIFDEVKEKQDFKEYCDEMGENNRILNEIPFDIQKAQQQISKLIANYQLEFNMLAYIYGNNMSVTNQPVLKTAENLKYDLRYINQHIPLFALERKGISDFLKQKMGF